MAKIVPSFSRLISRDALDSAVHNKPRPASINYPKPKADSDDAVIRASARPSPAAVDVYGPRPRPTNEKPKATADQKPVPSATAADVYYPAADVASADADISPSAVSKKK